MTNFDEWYLEKLEEIALSLPDANTYPYPIIEVPIIFSEFDFSRDLKGNNLNEDGTVKLPHIIKFIRCENEHGRYWKRQEPSVFTKL